jgi:hypothetical protein
MTEPAEDRHSHGRDPPTRQESGRQSGDGTPARFSAGAVMAGRRQRDHQSIEPDVWPQAHAIRG